MRKILLFAILSLFSIPATQAQDMVDEWAKTVLIKSRSLQSERVYLHFDNSAYYLGESIWFKAYVTSGNYDYPTRISRVLYVELVSPEGYVVETKKYKIDADGSCNGEFELHTNLLSGFYEIRAYTRYMTNWGKEAVFSRVFPIFDKVNADNWDFKNMLDRKRGATSSNKLINEEESDANLRFYPESGNLVEGIESKVAFELKGLAGCYVNDTITIYENNKVLSKVAPSHNGKGIFKITPKGNSKYNAEVFISDKNNKKKKHTFALPKVHSFGANMNIVQDSNNIHITIKNNFSENFPMGLAVMYRGSMGYYKKYLSSEKEYKFEILKNELPEGVCKAILFVDDTIPLAERQFFVEHKELQKNDRQTVKLTVKANNYYIENYVPKPNEKIKIEIGREDGKPIENDAEFTFSVRDAAGNQTTSWSYNMYSYLLLGSDLKGYIPDAAQYFDKENKDREKNLDLIMLTNGWTSYDWDKLALVDISSLQEIEPGLIITGKLYKRIAKKKNNVFDSYNLIKMKEAAVRLDIPQQDNSVEMSVFRTDNRGKFLLKLDDFYGKKVVSLTAEGDIRGVEGIDYAFALDRYFSPAPRYYNYWERNLGSSIVHTHNKLSSNAGSMTKVNPFEYLLGELDVVSRKEVGQFLRPPMSELRLDYLDEWEYAQDVTYLTKSRYSQYHLNELQEAIALEDELDTGGYMQEVTERDRMPQYRHALTAEDIMNSAAKRHKLNWSFWTQFVVVEGECEQGSLPKINNSYLHGKDPEKMTNFKEIVIRSDKQALALVENTGEGFWTSKSNAIESKHPYKMFYGGFLTRHSTMPSPEEITQDGPFGSFEKLYNAYKSQNVEMSMRNPNYLACFVPYSRKDSSPIIPDLQGLSESRRYTMLQGYSKSKEFYSPDYSNDTPIENDYRRTLLWMPNVRVENGNVAIELYNTASCSTVDVSVLGRYGNVYYSNDHYTETRYDSTLINVVRYVDASEAEKKIIEFNPDSITLAVLERNYNTGLIYYNKGNYRKAVVSFAELIQYNYPPAYYSVARCYLLGQGLAQNDTLAAEFMKGAAQRSYPEAQYEYAIMCKDAVGRNRDKELYFYWLQNAANGGEPRALVEMGDNHLKGNMVEKDSVMAFECFRLSAEKENAVGLYRYAIAMESDPQYCADKNEIISCMKKAAGQGLHEAMVYMMNYEHSQKNYKAAYSWARKLSLENNHYGTTYVADCYYEGRAVGRDKRLAKDLYRQAAYAGNSDAAEKLRNFK
ncbi:MAG: hypothetical protein IKV17_04070 [Bacteroidaceae bacterium]|nr:hypothetical protein [Bacteroidaceae bacterium]